MNNKIIKISSIVLLALIVLLLILGLMSDAWMWIFVLSLPLLVGAMVVIIFIVVLVENFKKNSTNVGVAVSSPVTKGSRQADAPYLLSQRNRTVVYIGAVVLMALDFLQYSAPRREGIASAGSGSVISDSLLLIVPLALVICVMYEHSRLRLALVGLLLLGWAILFFQ